MEPIKHTGKSFGQLAKTIVSKQKGISLSSDVALLIGVIQKKKLHRFDLGNLEDKVLVECKHHAWIKAGHSPSAKMTILNEAMLYFSIVPKEFSNILFISKSIHIEKKPTLAEHYYKTHFHLIPDNVEIWKYDFINEELRVINV